MWNGSEREAVTWPDVRRFWARQPGKVCRRQLSLSQRDAGCHWCSERQVEGKIQITVRVLIHPLFFHVHRLRKKSLPRSCRSRCWARSVSSPNRPAPSRIMRSLASWEATPRSTSSVGGWALGSTRGWWWWRGREWALRPEFQTSVARGVASTIRWKGGRTYPVPNLCLTLNSSRRTPSPSSPWPNSYIPASTHRRMHTTLSDTCPTVAFCFVATHRWGTGHVCVRVYVSDPPWVVWCQEVVVSAYPLSSIYIYLYVYPFMCSRETIRGAAWGLHWCTPES